MKAQKSLSAYLDDLKPLRHNLWNNLVQNNVDYFALKHFDGKLKKRGVRGIKDKRAKCEASKRKFTKTLDLLSEIKSKTNFVLIKSWRGYDVVGSDIDVLASTKSDFKKIKEFLLKNNFYRQTISKIKFWDSCNEKYKEIWRNKKGEYCTVHLHEAIAWKGINYASKKNILSNIVRKKIFGRSFAVPAHNEDFMIQAAHLLFEVHQFRLGDFLHIDELISSNKLNMKKIIENSKSFGWCGGVQLIKKYHHKISESLEKDKPLLLPLPLPRRFLFSLRIKKILGDIRNLKGKEVAREVISYCIDFASLFVFKPLRARGIIK